MIFAITIPAIVNYFVSGVSIPKVGKEPELIADMDNCLTNIDDVKETNAYGIPKMSTRSTPGSSEGTVGNVKSLFNTETRQNAPRFKVSKTVEEVNQYLDYITLTVKDYPGYPGKSFTIKTYMVR